MRLNLSEIGHRAGWCRKKRVSQNAPLFSFINPFSSLDEPAGKGTSVPEVFDRGMKLALGSIRILMRNPRLLWFSLCLGLVILASTIRTAALQASAGGNLFSSPQALHPAPVSVFWIVLVFSSLLVTIIIWIIAVIGLITCVYGQISGRTLSVREGIANFRRYLIPSLSYAVFLSTVTTTVFVLAASQVFSLALLTAYACLVGVALGTFFIIPVIVFEQKSFPEAIKESFSLVKKTIGEIVVSNAIILIIFFGLLIALIGLAALYGPSKGQGLTSPLGLIILLFIGILVILITTFAEILLAGLYSLSKTGEVPELFIEKKRDYAIQSEAR